MRQKTHSSIIILLVLFSVGIPIVNANVTKSSSNCPVSKRGETRVIQSFNNLCVKSHFSGDEIIINVKNPSGKYVGQSGILIQVDGADYYDESFAIQSGEQLNYSMNITEGLDVIENKHTVTVSTYGNYTTYNFTKKINASAGTV